MRVIFPSEAKKYDEASVNAGVPSLLLMEAAADALTAAVMRRSPKRVFVFALSGGNGGDGFAAARKLNTLGVDTTVVFLGDQDKATEDTRVNMRAYEGEVLRDYQILDMSGAVVLDALLGTGLSRDVKSEIAEAITFINRSGAYVISADIPSGINAADGQMMGAAVKANETVTFQAAKVGHFVYPGREYTGALTVSPIGIARDVFESDMQSYPSRTKELRLKKRASNSHKGTYGYLGIIGAKMGMTGATSYVARAATTAGAGVVNILAQPGTADIYAKTLPFAVSIEGNLSDFLNGKAALAVGSGLGDTQIHLNEMLLHPCVVDADALTSDTEVFKYAKNAVLTPHPKEFSRMTGISVTDILSDPVSAVSAFCARYSVTLLLKGATTIVGTGSKISFVLAGSPGMAKGGSGDVLTGVIAALLSQGYTPHEAATLGAHLCGLAGERAAEIKGVISATPSDTIRHLPEIIKEFY